MPVIAAALPAMRAYLPRDVREEDGKSIMHPDFIGSAYFAALDEVFEDGTLVPTESIGIQDTEQLLAMADPVATLEDENGCTPDEEEEWWLGDVKGWSPDEPLDGDSDAIWLDTDLDEILEERFLDEWRPWTAEEEPSTFPRYQIYVLLASDARE
jgi:hypothetical protein